MANFVSDLSTEFLRRERAELEVEIMNKTRRLDAINMELANRSLNLSAPAFFAAQEASNKARTELGIDS